MKIIDLTEVLPVHASKKVPYREIKGIDKIIVHNTDSSYDPLCLARRDLAPNSISRTGCPTLIYHDLIDRHGTVFHCVKYEAYTWHTPGFNKDSISIGLMYRSTNLREPGLEYEFSMEQYISLSKQLTVLCLYLRLPPDRIYGHREMPDRRWFWQKGHRQMCASCPGLRLDLEMLRNSVASRLQRRLAVEQLYKGRVDGEFKEESKEALQAFNPASSIFRKGST